MGDAIEPPRCSEDGLEDLGPYDSDRIAQVAKALAHPARVRIVQQFDSDESHYAQEIVGNCDLAQSTVSEHLRILREAGVLVSRKEGSWIWYCISPDTLAGFLQAIESLIAPVPDPGTE